MILIHRRQSGTDDGVQLAPLSSAPELGRINPVYAVLVRVFGPAECSDNPLEGTKYDSLLALQRERERFERRSAKAIPRWQRREQRLHGHDPLS